jgi:3-carboxy-cis,cis-muconate cycloisomerase
MASIVIGSKLFGDMFGSEEMCGLFTDEYIVQIYLDVEAALARAQAKLGIVPEKAAEAITAAARVENIDWQKLAERTQIVGYPILPLVEQMSQWPDDNLGQWCHWGATTQDIMDTADVLQFRRALALISAELDAVAEALAGLTSKYADLPMAGRTHLQHALPITFGYKAATWLSAIDRHRQRLGELKNRIDVVSFSGAAGTLASLGEKNGLATQAALAVELDLQIPAITWHTIRDNFAEMTGLLAMISASVGKIGYDIMLMMQTETGEVLEPFVPGRGASSTMPQKRNPISSEMMLAAAKIVREQHSAMLDAVVQDHERATGQWHVEWQVIPTAFIVTSGGLKAAREALEGLEVRPEAMKDVLNVTGGLIAAEAVMMGLAPHLGRQVAHDVVYEACRNSLSGSQPFIDALAANPIVTECFSRQELEHFLDPANYVGAAPVMARRLLEDRTS